MSAPLNEKAPVYQDQGTLSENRNDDANHHKTTEKESGPWFRCTRCATLSHISVMSGLADSCRCLSCGFSAVPCDLSAERAERAAIREAGRGSK
jgi:hypothetical protein